MVRKRKGLPPKYKIRLKRKERGKLEQTARRQSQAYRQVLRARLILALEENPCVSEVAKQFGVDVKTVRRWRDRFVQKQGKEPLRDKPRSGRPPRISLVTRCELLSMACARPSDFGELSREVWTIDSLLNSFRRQHPRTTISRTSLLRILNQAEIRPHHVRMWLHSPDPLFKEKVKKICRLYLHPPKDSVVLCVDEKSGMQALGRKHPFRPASPGRSGRVDCEYVRHGTRTLLAALNPHTGKVYAEVRASRKATDIIEFMEEVARRYPKKKIHIIWDNLNIHKDGKDNRWKRFNRRHGHRFRFHYTPFHASWVNQIEIFFSIVHKRVLRYGVFHRVKDLEVAVSRFIRHWNQHEAHPFRWTFKGYPLQSTSKAA